VRKVTVTPRAEQDLEDIWITIAADNSRAADNLIRRIFHKAELAKDQPGMGAHALNSAERRAS